ncbi:hypothetical protein [Tychonema sp. BBK16]|uniref:hypothetical protein n=1 Tax=Tychonema sp. BBK16 TaxID=2699888 RepID=UPI001F365D5D|nr:hypothetical protein [Tychonema sp. BBK16]MCF6375041.1 hypothetical protein [Tychonema sp. BBK16]
MITTIDNFTKQIFENLETATTIFLAMARIEETQKPTSSAIASRLDAKVAAGITEKPELDRSPNDIEDTAVPCPYN